MPNDHLTIEQVSPNDRGGGAERVANDLHLGLLRRGVDAWLALGVDHREMPNTLQIPNNERRGAWARGVLRAAGLYDPAAEPPLPAPVRRAARLLAEPRRYARVLRGMEDFEFPGTHVLPELPPRPPDVLHLHNLHGAYFDIRALPRLASRIPLLLTMHDAWLLTGHCAYPMECEGWATGCVGCPATSRYVPIARDAAAENLRVKRQAVAEAGPRLSLAMPSEWLARLVERSGFADLVREVRVIPNGVDTAVFHPGDRAEARARLGLPADAVIIAFAARGATTSEFKGFDVLADGLPEIVSAASGAREDRAVRPHLMLAIGGDPGAEQAPGLPIRHVPFIEDRAALADHFRAADLYVHPAVAESFGLAPLEAMACGTPVVASDVGGIPEVVGDAGVLFAPGDPKALAEAALSVLGDARLAARLSLKGAERARTLFPFERQLDAYLAWYHELAEDAR